MEVKHRWRNAYWKYFNTNSYNGTRRIINYLVENSAKSEIYEAAFLHLTGGLDNTLQKALTHHIGAMVHKESYTLS